MTQICVGRRAQLAVCCFREKHLVASFQNCFGLKGKFIHAIRLKLTYHEIADDMNFVLFFFLNYHLNWDGIQCVAIVNKGGGEP